MEFPGYVDVLRGFYGVSDESGLSPKP